MADNNEIAIFGGGCFWCTEAVFDRLKGVQSVTSGYSGGDEQNPTYEQVSSGTTDFAEAVKIEYDPDIISYGDLLAVFFSSHDPTSLDRQGNDVGSQYRSIIFYTNDEQQQEAGEFIDKLGKQEIYDQPIVTEIQPFANFTEAEEHHRHYYEKNKEKPYSQLVINPKLEKLQKKYSHLLK